MLVHIKQLFFKEKESSFNADLIDGQLPKFQKYQQSSSLKRSAYPCGIIGAHLFLNFKNLIQEFCITTSPNGLIVLMNKYMSYNK